MLTSKRLNINSKDGVLYITFPIFENCNKVRHAFTTKVGGVSQGIYATMNMSLTGGDNPETVKENYRRICKAVGINAENLVLSHQTHTANILCVSSADKGKGIWRERDYSDIDALITNEKNIALVTQFADCTPLLFCDPKKEVIALAHAGWRGTVQKIGKKTVEKMVERYGCNPADILAAIGPSIGKCCYEVDDPLLEQFTQSGFDIQKIFTPKGGGKYMLDLWEANRLTLIESGILPTNIDTTDLCTNCNPDVFHSHRFTKGKRGTLAAILELK